MIRRDHHEIICNLREGRIIQMLIEVPIEVTLSSDEDPSEVHPVPAGEPNLDWIQLPVRGRLIRPEMTLRRLIRPEMTLRRLFLSSECRG